MGDVIAYDGPAVQHSRHEQPARRTLFFHLNISTELRHSPFVGPGYSPDHHLLWEHELGRKLLLGSLKQVRERVVLDVFIPRPVQDREVKPAKEECQKGLT